MTATVANNPGATFPVVQAVRGLAAFWVLLFHASEGHHIDPLKAVLPHGVVATVFDAGHYGVAIFFALSGFVIALSLRAIEPSWSFLWRFAARRSIRLDPPYWASMLFVIAMAWLSGRITHQPYVYPSADTVAAHLVYAQVMLDQPAINSVYWTLTYEVQFYLVLAGALVLVGKGGASSSFLLWGGMTLLAIASAFGILTMFPHGLFTEMWAAFFVGVLGYKTSTSRAAWPAFAVLVAAMLLIPGGKDPTFFRLSGAAAVLLTVALHSGYIAKGMDWAWLQFLGTISYSLYLLHNPITGAVGYVMRMLLGTSLAASIATLLCIIVASVLGATVFWRAIELTSHRWSRRVRLTSAAPRRASAVRT